MNDNDITSIVGWPTEPEMVKYRAVARAALEQAAKECEEYAFTGEPNSDATARCLARDIRALKAQS